MCELRLEGKINTSQLQIMVSNFALFLCKQSLKQLGKRQRKNDLRPYKIYILDQNKILERFLYVRMGLSLKKVSKQSFTYLNLLNC